MTQPPTLLLAVAWIAVLVAIASAGFVVCDILARGHRQRMRVMEWVWPVTCLYTGVLGVWAYCRLGLPRSPAWLQQHGVKDTPDQSRWVSSALGVTHCGAGCTLGDIVAEWVVFTAGWTIAGESFYPEVIGDYILAILLGLIFQYFAIASMRDLGLREGIVAAAKADILSLTAFEVGLFGWMALQAFVIFPAPHHLHPDSPVYWFGMQIGMCLGFITAYPINAWLVRRGIKEAM